jgi:putative drug exporter of the RND superfamily
VRTATRPSGEQINEISLPEQIAALTAGIGRAGGGFDALAEGLSAAKDGVDKVAGGLDSGKDGIGRLSDGTVQAKNGVDAVGSGLSDLSKAETDAIAGVGQLKTGMTALNGGLSQSKSGLNDMQAALNGAKQSLEAMAAANPALMMDPHFQTAYGTVKAIMGNIPAMSKGIDDLKGGVTKSQNGLTDAGAGLKQIKEGIDQSKAALGQVKTGLGDLKTGQDEAAAQLGLASASLNTISEGLAKSIDGINQMKTELTAAGKSAEDWAAGLKGLNSVFYLPTGLLDKYPQLKEYMQTYISPDGHGITFDVILTQPPYSKEALDSISKIYDAVRFSLKDGPLEGAEFHVTGSTGAYSELRQITADDFIKVMIFVLLGIFIVLAILLRSLTAPLYLIFTIVVSYLTTLGISYLVFQVGFGKEGLSWAVPFFSFCLLVALGVDYNIFLMSRVKEEYRPGDAAGGTARALASTGKIITSCGLIMAGTFGAMLFSPVTQLVQIGFTTVAGLLLDTFIVRCMLVPAIVVKFGELNWWPGRKVRVIAVEETIVESKGETM